MPSYIQNYYTQLRTWENSITYDHLWKVDINFPQTMLRQAERLISTYDGATEAVNQQSINNSLNLINQSTRDNGLFYARAVTLPSEASAINQGTNNGYLVPLISSGRAEVSTVSITFLETNISLENPIRAWIKVVGNYGLIARSGLAVHGSMNIHLLGPSQNLTPDSSLGQTLGPQANGLTRPMSIRKTLSFENVVPVSCQATTYSQKSLGMSVEFTVVFKFERYCVV